MGCVMSWKEGRGRLLYSLSVSIFQRRDAVFIETRAMRKSMDSGWGVGSPLRNFAAVTTEPIFWGV